MTNRRFSFLIPIFTFGLLVFGAPTPAMSIDYSVSVGVGNGDGRTQSSIDIIKFGAFFDRFLTNRRNREPANNPLGIPHGYHPIILSEEIFEPLKISPSGFAWKYDHGQDGTHSSYTRPCTIETYLHWEISAQQWHARSVKRCDIGENTPRNGYPPLRKIFIDETNGNKLSRYFNSLQRDFRDALMDPDYETLE